MTDHIFRAYHAVDCPCGKNGSIRAFEFHREIPDPVIQKAPDSEPIPPVAAGDGSHDGRRTS